MDRTWVEDAKSEDNPLLDKSQTRMEHFLAGRYNFRNYRAVQDVAKRRKNKEMIFMRKLLAHEDRLTEEEKKVVFEIHKICYARHRIYTFNIFGSMCFFSLFMYIRFKRGNPILRWLPIGSCILLSGTIERFIKEYEMKKYSTLALTMLGDIGPHSTVSKNALKLLKENQEAAKR